MDEAKQAVLQVENSVNFQSDSGYTIGVLTDLQKLFACATVSDDEKDSGMFTPEIKNDLKFRVSHHDKYSARLNLLFRSNRILKTEFQRLSWLNQVTGSSIQTYVKFSLGKQAVVLATISHLLSNAPGSCGRLCLASRTPP